MSSKKFRKTRNKTKPEPPKRKKAPFFVWVARVIIILLCVAVAVTLIPSVFF